jgi:hypothetical protein
MAVLPSGFASSLRSIRASDRISINVRIELGGWTPAVDGLAKGLTFRVRGR